MTEKTAPPWNRPAKSGTHHSHLTAKQRRSAKSRAKQAGRPYPNLVDNMNAARRGK